jgi:hypothetical protein
MSSGGTISAVNGDFSFNSLGSGAATALFLHFTVFVNGGRDTLTGAHVDFKVSFGFTHNTFNFDRDSSNEVGRDSATTNSWGWFSAFFNASVFGPVDVFFWALFKHDFSGGEAFGVNVSFSLFTSALDAFVFGSRPAITDLSFFIIFVGATQWNAHTATFAGIGDSDMTHWAITAAFSVTNWNEQTFHVWSTWARAGSAWIAHWTPEGTWLVSFSFELTDVEWDASPFDVTLTTADNWGINWSSTVWAVLKWWLNTANTFDSILATAANTDVSDGCSDFTVSTWKTVRSWTVAGITDTFVVVATSWGSWVVSLDQNWFGASIGASNWSWNWTRWLIADTLFFVDSSATSTWSFNMDLGSGDHLESSWASGILVINWTFRRVATASVLWATFAFSSTQNRANSVTSWSWWTDIWVVNANVIVSRAASMIFAIDIDGDWKFFDEASEFNGTVFDDWSSAVFWVADTLELWTTVFFGGTFFTMSASRSNDNSDLFTSDTVSFFVSFSSFGTSGGITFTRFTAATRVSRFVEGLVFVADWISVVEWTRLNGAFASPDWATTIDIVGIVTEGFNFTKFTLFTDWTFGAVLRNVFSAFDWLAPFFSATSSGIRTDSFDFEFGTRNGFVSALDDFFDDHTWVIASASSFNTFVFLSTVVFVPEFTGGMFDTTLISANVAIGWIDTFISLKN